MKVNGEQIQLTKATTLEEFLKEQGYNIQRIAIERNDEIVPRENFSDVMLSDSDIIEVYQGYCFGRVSFTRKRRGPDRRKRRNC